MGIKVAYGKRGDITGAIGSGVIPKDSLVVTSDAKEAELYFYDTDGQIKYVSVRKRFESMDEAREWIKTYDCAGHIISVYDGGNWAPYIVTSGGELTAVIPTVTTDDNGKVLKVVDGVWTAEEEADSLSLGLTGAAAGQLAKVSAVDDSGVPTAWEPVDMPTGGTGGGGVQSDWNQNDETQADYVKNRPCVVGEDGVLAWNVPPVSDATILDALKEIDALPVVTDGGKILTANDKILLW